MNASRRSIAVVASVIAAQLAGPAQPAHAQQGSWWHGDYPVLLGYGCTTFWLEPVDRRFACSPAMRIHEGIDLDMPIGTPLVAGQPGRVIDVGGAERHDYGAHYVRIWLAEGHDILLGHLSSTDLKVGDRVEVGDPVGRTGDLGMCNWPNLHFEVRAHGGSTFTSVDPARYLDALEPGRVRSADRAHVERFLRGEADEAMASEATVYAAPLPAATTPGASAVVHNRAVSGHQTRQPLPTRIRLWLAALLERIVSLGLGH